MPSDWQRRRILIWGKTRPEMSRKYREVVCTGGVFEDSKSLVRLYPVPLRYMDDANLFKKYQWVEADVRPAERDSRPESYNIRANDITPGEVIAPQRGKWSIRASWILSPQNLFESVEHLQRRQREDGTSLGLVQPREIVRVSQARVPRAERESCWQRYQETLAQLALPDEGERVVKPLTPSDFQFVIAFRCHDASCKGHQMKVLDWEVDALYFGQVREGRDPDVAARKVVEKLEESTSEARDCRFFLGNISTHLTRFTIVGLWCPKKQPVAQPNLFDGLG
jgi:hypothetical protein